MKPAKDGEWIQPIHRGYKLECCDCGLVHRLDYRIVTGHVQFRAVRDARSTAQIRRYRQVAARKAAMTTLRGKHHHPQIQVNVTAVDPEGQPIEGAIVTLFLYDAGGQPCPFEPAIRNWANFYDADKAYKPHDHPGPFTLYGQATANAQGYGTAYIPMTPWDGNSSLDLTVTLAPFV